MEEKKIVLVSGGSRGLGKAIVFDLLKNNCIVATFGRTPCEYISDIIDYGYKDVFFYKTVDITDHNLLKEFVFDVHKKYGSIDALINNAGINLDQLVSMTTDDQIHSILLTNVEATIILSRMVVRFMMLKKRGEIINISSVVGIRGFKGASVYSASKSALDGFTRSTARELGNLNIRVNSIAPGFLDTDMTKSMPENQKNQIIRRTPLNRLGKCEDIIGLVYFLLSPASSFITGQCFVVDGGLTC